MEDLKEVVRLNELYELYKDLFTDKQREYFEAFYAEDLSLSEIAEERGISRAAVHSQVKIVKDELERLEEALHLLKLNDMIDELKELKDSKVDKIIEKYEEN